MKKPKKKAKKKACCHSCHKGGICKSSKLGKLLRNGTNNYRAGHIVDSGAATNRDGGALDTNFHVYTIRQDSSGNAQIWDNGVSIAASATWGGATATTLNCAALFALAKAMRSVILKGSSGYATHPAGPPATPLSAPTL